MDEWIKVEDRLPEPMKEVLVYNGVGRAISIGYLKKVMCSGIPCWVVASVALATYSTTDVSAWMPLPKGPVQPQGCRALRVVEWENGDPIYRHPTVREAAEWITWKLSQGRDDG